MQGKGVKKKMVLRTLSELGLCGGVWRHVKVKGSLATERMQFALKKLIIPSRHEEDVGFNKKCNYDLYIVLRAVSSSFSKYVVSSSVPVEMRKQPSHPGSFPRNRTTTACLVASFS